MQPINNHKDLYIFGRPIQTELGVINPVKVKDLPEFLELYPALTLTKFGMMESVVKYKRIIIDYYKNANVSDELIDMLVEPLDLILNEMRELDVFHILHSAKEVAESGNDIMLYEYYKLTVDLFDFVFEDDGVFLQIQSEEEYQDYLEIIRDMNGIEFERPNPNPAIERRNAMKRWLNAQKGGSVTYEAIITSVQVATGLDVFELTLYQLNKLFDRVGHFKNFDLTGLYSLMSSEVEVANWFATAKKEEKKYLTQEELDRAKNNGATINM